MKASQGDMRKAVTFLQSSHQLSSGSSGNVVTVRMVVDISGQVCNLFIFYYVFLYLYYTNQ
jgi:hypothetical protein